MAGTTENHSNNYSSLRFPSHYDAESGHWMMYKRKKYKRTTIKDLATLVDVEGSKTIALPLPPQLAKGYSAQWDNESLGIFGNFTNDAAGRAISEFRKSYNSGNSTAIESAIDGLQQVGNKPTAMNGLKAFSLDALTSSDTFRQAGKSTGIARNPHKAMLFNSVQFRSFEFSYHFVATSYEESLTIGNIIKEFELGMSPDFEPGYENNLYTYPDIFVINFEKEKHLFKIAPCILTSMITDYHAEGSAMYFTKNDEKLPASIRLSLSFQEIVVLSREDFKNGY